MFKSIYFTLLFVVNTVYSQPHLWKVVDDLTVSHSEYVTFYDGRIIDSLNAVFVFIGRDLPNTTSKFFLKKTTDGGLTWQIISSWGSKEGTFPRFIDCVDGNVIFGGCQSIGTLIATKDGGKTWKRAYQGDAYTSINMISMLDSSEGILNIEDANYSLLKVLYTNDSWQTTKEILPPSGYVFMPYKILNNNLIGFMQMLDKRSFICKGYINNSTSGEVLLKTTDAGESWKIVSNPISGVKNNYMSTQLIHFKNSKVAWLHAFERKDSVDAVRAFVSETKDGGETWTNKKEYIITNSENISSALEFYTNDGENLQIAAPVVSRRSKDGVKWQKDTITSIPNIYQSGTKFFKKRFEVKNYLMMAGHNKIIKDFGEFTPVHIVEYGRAINVSIFPNPATSHIEIGLAAEGSGRILVYNTLGELMFEQAYIQSNHVNLDVSTLADGCYNAVIENGNERVTKKIIVSR